MTRRAHGFSLLEVMVAMVILSIGVLGTGALISLSIVKTAHGRKVSAAQHLGGEILEHLRLDVRFDGEGTFPFTDNSGLANGVALKAADAWRGDRLPYRSADAVPAEAGASLTTCQPEGVEDGVEYGVGPLPFQVEPNLYWVCYGLDPNIGGFPPNSVGAVVKVIWSGGNGYRARHVFGVLVSGA